jgi:chemotaxis protein methyltransferase CheR
VNNNGRFKELYSFIEEVSGFSSLQISSGIIDSTISMLMKKWNCTNEAEFIHTVSQSPKAMDEFISRLTIKETFFFREEAAIWEAVNHLIPSILEKKRNCTILSAGCSTGAELYSVAFAIDSVLGRASLERCHFIGVDIDASAVATAQKGGFSLRLLRGLPESYRNSYLHTEDGQDFTVLPRIHKSLSFLTLNLTNARDIEKLPPCDIIFYRNVSIYFGPQTRLQVFNNLSELLVPQGALFTGSSETIAHAHGVLKLLQKKDVFYFTKDSTCSSTDQCKPLGSVHEQKSSSVVIAKKFFPKTMEKPLEKKMALKPSPQSPLRVTKQQISAKERDEDPIITALQLVRAGYFGQAQQILNTLPDTKKASNEAKMIQASLYFEQGILESAKDQCLSMLETDSLSLEAHLLLGLIYRHNGAFDRALEELKQCIYIDSEYWVAQFHVAQIYEKLQQQLLAVRAYRRTMHVLQSYDTIKERYVLFPLNEQGVKNIIRLCEIGIKQIEGA